MEGKQVYSEASTQPGVTTVVTQNAGGYYTTYQVNAAGTVLSSKPGNHTGWGG